MINVPIPLPSKIDVVMLTWNSNYPLFPRIVQSILGNCHLCHLIVIDRYSTDGTQDTLLRLVPRAQLKLIESDYDLAEARRFGVEQVDTEWFAFIDSDVELCDRWHEKMDKYISADPRLGAIQAIFEGSHQGTGDGSYFLVRKEEVTPGMIVRCGLFTMVKGLTSQTLIRKEAIKSWRPPANLCAFEDYHLTQHLLNKGWRWLRVLKVSSLHHKKGSSSELLLYYKQGLWEGANAQIIEATKFLYFLLEICSRFLGGSLRSIRQQSGRSFIANLLFRLGYLRGYLRPFRFRRWVR